MKKTITLYFLLGCGLAFGQQKDTLVYNTKREVKLEGTSNFRDLGGYPAQGGRHVKWGRIYRSADIGKLTDKDVKALTDLNIETVCDFRGPDEIQKSPDRLPSSAKWINLPAGSEKGQSSLLGLKSIQPDSAILSMYLRTDHLKAKYKPIFDQLLALDDQSSLLFHCTAGKDRTGVGAALILSALGVDKQTILNDYQATNYYWKGGSESVQRMLKAQGMDEKMVKAMLAADPKYLSSAFSAIDSKYGSMDQFLSTEMDLTPVKRAALQAKYLQ